MSATKADEPRRRRRRILRRVLLVAFLSLVGVLLARYARGIDWNRVIETLRDYRGSTLAAAAALAATSYALFGSFDVLARRLVGHRVPPATSWAIGATSYAFNLNLGAFIGGLGLRVRLYTRHGLDAGTTARVVATCIATNWLGYLGLAGAAFASGGVEPPSGWRVGAGAMQAIGVAMLGAFGALLVACSRSRRRTWSLRGHEIPVPTLRGALVMAGVSAANWLAMSALMATLLSWRVPLPTVAAVLLVAAVAGVLTHVPAGLGVLETVFLVLLGARVPQHELLAALLAYRAIYYVAPLAIAAIAWPVLESRGGRPAPARPRPSPGTG